MPVCEDCKKEVAKNYQLIETKRHTKLCFCNECMAKYKRKEVDSASNNRKPIR